MSKNLVIVESPTKAKTISHFLGSDFNIQSSFGHIRDLPKNEMGVDTKNDFKPRYITPTRARKTTSLLKKEAKKSASVYFATDEDREGEAIAWHLAQILGLSQEKIKRIVFHEITREAIEEALKNPRGLDINMVDAQQARRILDRLVGYELSPFLWHKVAKGLSAGRVQSVALRLIAEREREIQNFKPQEYWLIDGEFKKKEGEEKFKARLYKIGENRLDKLSLKTENETQVIVKELKNASFSVWSQEKKETKRNPLPPFTTSSLQQEANRRFGYSAKKTMFLAQQLYEGVELPQVGSVGLITYMRTDSVNLAEKFLKEAREYLEKKLGQEYALASSRKFKVKSKLAQEAHEAIRPTEIEREPESLKNSLTPEQYKIYKLIWQRALASQMPEAVLLQTTVLVSDNNQKYFFRAQGMQIKFDGFLKIYPNNKQEIILPPLEKNEELIALSIDPKQIFTEPPARYSEAGLVKILEEYGIGRPSTYVPIMSTIQERGYVEKIERRFKPKDIGFLVNDVLVKHFPEIMDYKFTARLEDDLDKIAEGKTKWVGVIKEFYNPFKEHLTNKEQEVSKKELTEEASSETCEKCGRPMIIKMGRYGKFLACSGFPECKNTKSLEKEGELSQQDKKILEEKCPQCGSPLELKRGRFGPFIGCSNYPNCKFIKNTSQSTGVKCPSCGQGEIVAKKSRKGRIFYACNQYPECKFALWSKPTGEKCQECGSLMVFGKNESQRCSNKECRLFKGTN